MRFKLTLSVEEKAFGNVLPINYQYEQSAVIYRILAKGSRQYTEWLHENGFRLENGKNFKLFTFSPLKIPKRAILREEERIKILCRNVEWEICFLPEKSTEKFIQGLFADRIFEIGDRRSVVQFKVQKVELLPSPEYGKEMKLETMSPMCLKDNKEDGSTEYVSPADPRAKGIILYGLMERYTSFYGKPYIGELSFDFFPEGECKRKVVKIKANTDAQTKVAGYKCKFTVKAPAELMQILYESGIGSLCSQGFGCVRERKN